MIEGKQFISTVEKYFNFIISEYSFTLLKEKISGNAYYDVQYRDKTRIISVSYENIEDYFLVIIYILQDNNLPSYDDKTKTLHLNLLNSIILPLLDNDEIKLNNIFFTNFFANNEFEKRLLKSAKELRICLNHFDEIIK